MRFTSHLAVALLIASLLLKLDFYNTAMVCFFSLLPDIDKPNSIIGSQFQKFSEKIYEEFGHRSLTHSLWFSLSTGLFFGAPALIGLLSHLLCDMLTPQGVGLFWPKSTRFVILSGIVNSKYEVLAVCIIFTGVMIKHFFI